MKLSTKLTKTFNRVKIINNISKCRSISYINQKNEPLKYNVLNHLGTGTGTMNKKTSIYNISDLHLEYYKDSDSLFNNIKHLLPDADILILPGDIGYPIEDNHEKNYISLLHNFKQKYKNVILVPGNHEYFETKNFYRKEINDRLKKICSITSSHLLNNDSIIINGIKFMGTTLWTKLDPRLEKMVNKNSKTFGCIFQNFKSYQLEFEKSFEWLRDELKTEHQKNIIITHHVPSFSLQHAKYKNKNLIFDSMFYSEILDSLDLSKVQYWFAGHTHESSSITHKNTTVCINPYGSPWEQHKKKTKTSSIVYYI